MEQEVLHHKPVETTDDDVKPSASQDALPVAQAAKKTSWLSKIWNGKPAPPVPAERQVSGAYNAGWLSILLFHWMVPLLSTGHKRPLELNDIWTVAPTHGVEKLVHAFKVCLAKRKHKHGKVPVSIPAMMEALRFDFVLSGIFFFVAEMLTILTPFTLRYLIFFVQRAYAGEGVNLGYGIGLVIIITAMQTIQSLCSNHYYYRAMLLGGQARSVLISCISEKALKLSARAKVQRGDDQGWNNGRINNLMSTDASCIDTAAVVCHKLWVTPIQVFLALALLCINLGPSALVGFGLIILTIPFLGRAAKFLIGIRKAVNQCTDKRVQLIVEAFSAIRVVKVFAWESRIEERIDTVRRKEVGHVNRAMMVRNGILVGAMMIVILATILTFITYSLAGNALNPAPVFSSLALFSCLSTPLENLPLAIGRSVDAWAAFKRMQSLLQAEERLDETIWQSDAPRAVQIKNASFTWDHEEEAATEPDMLDEKMMSTVSVMPSEDDASIHHSGVFGLKDISLAVERSELLAVIGTVGSGKSSLLAALAGDMRKLKGQVILGGTRALCSEVPWIQNATARDNITFGSNFDQMRYDAVVAACALTQDFDMLPHGDKTDIGERGITLSGGQKQRLNIARSIYSNTDIVLLDDPLSAVDAHVGQHIMQNAICGLLKGKCRILATHQLHFLPLTDRIVWIREGTIYKVATYAELLENDAGFRQLVQTTSKNDQTNLERAEAQADEPKKAVEKSAGATVMQAEERSLGRVPLKVYAGFIRASGTLWNIAIMLALLSIAQGTRLFNGVWLTWWASNRVNASTGTYMGVYVATGVASCIMMFIWGTALTTMCLRASRILLNHAIGNTVRAPVAFFDTTPLGRITNRFSKDVDTIDGRMTMNALYFFYILASIFSVFGLVLAYYYYFIAALVPLFGAFVFAAAYYRASAREIKRHEAVLRSVVFSRFSEAVSGTTTIQAYAAEGRFQKSISQALDDMNGAYFLTFSGQRWLSVHLSAVGNMLIFVIGILIVASHLRDTVDPSIAGLILAYMLTIIGLIEESVHTYSDLQNDMNSVERLYHYAYDLEQEAPNEKRQADSPPPSWPNSGAVTFSEVSLRYRPGLPLVLKDLSFEVRSGERIGVIGRTGAGKSSIMTALFRLVEAAEGKILIDGVDISKLKLQTLRSQLAMIPQDPTLFMGTIRSNLDPFGEHEDLKLWIALRQANLVEETATAGDRIALDTAVEAEGHNFSLGQRQLLALARVLVRNTRIVICDEATSSVDFETDMRVQKTMIRAFKGKTVLCIAHRLRTIVGYDRILVMDAGQVADFDTPLALFSKESSIFRTMCDRSGISRRDIELSIAEMQAEVEMT